ncbi:heavy-metal-associated domain-containing protein [Rhodococcus globerulus]|uniref:heavy-metal-associated domain-containing protein n=1 Tax=Rhodococcus globerulus TaxID=33008 RepID=UPI001F217428|nr:heavy metal-associated domain-containing protein [Rhodococcus globerulus]MCE4269250.1 heavy-metal-associated domain-containing protein [Rhodococcus globerulus]
MKSTTYAVTGMTCDRCARAIKDKVSRVPGVGAVAVEILADSESRLILKHKDDVELERSDVEAAVHRAGDYHLTGS